MYMSLHSQSVRIVVLPIGRATLVVACKPAVDARKTDAEINRSALLVQKSTRASVGESSGVRS